MSDVFPEDLTPISELGEFGLIEKLTSPFRIRRPATLKAVGDDAAVYRVGNGKVHVVSTDLLMEGIHFDLTYAPLKHVGYKAVIVNLSDIYAMNAMPFGITVSIAMSNRFTLEAMEAFYEGVKVACDEHNVDLLGGDTSSSHTGLCISITALGEADEDKVVYRNGARENNLICVSGDLGGGYAGLNVLEREKRAFLANPDLQPELVGYDYVVGRVLKPEARRPVIEVLEKEGILPTSMIDISDGLTSELYHICNHSRTGATIYEEKLPIDPETWKVAEEFKISASTFALNGGDDYELLFTVKLEDFDKVSRISEIHVIGHITEPSQGVNMVLRSGGVVELEAQGWQHFSSEK
ncbi:MAG: thiamine-phosphate kinase [Bacteroidia bacterium]|nr:thiamine-phosphate kinase [Bacteroidia bacterium]